MKALKVFFLIFALTSLAGCGNILYISKLGWYQSFISFHSVPVQEVLADKGADEETKEKIRFIQEVKRFGGPDGAKLIWDAIERRLKERG